MKEPPELPNLPPIARCGVQLRDAVQLDPGMHLPDVVVDTDPWANSDHRRGHTRMLPLAPTSPLLVRATDAPMLPAGASSRRRSAVPLTSEQRRARAQLAAHRRHHGDDAELPDQAAQLEQAALDKHIDDLVA
jgi:hypothetical protein